jgi:hypothetical protein
MALKVINAAFTSKGYPADASSGILAGMVVAFQADGSGLAELVKADRATMILSSVAGLAYDDAYNVGNTIVMVDPVTLAYSAKPARKISDYKDETNTVVTNWTDTGIAKRNVTVMSVGGEFLSDKYSSTYTTASLTTDTATTPVLTQNVNLTFGVTALAGVIVSDGTLAGAYAATASVARVLDGVSGGLLSFRWVGN